MKLERLILNFNKKCNMSCPYCYIPFDGRDVLRNTPFRIVERCGELGFKTITIGGGDPFIYKEIVSLIREANELGLEVQVDTNGQALSQIHYEAICEWVSLLSLPLDGSSKEVHDAMRGVSNNFNKVMGHLSALKDSPIRVKVNTLASRINLHDIPNIPLIIEEFRVRIWSLYQFKPLHDAANQQERYHLSNKDYSNLIENIPAMSARFEPGTAEIRHGSYVFVSPNGEVYSHDPRDPRRYLPLGDFFDEAWISELESLVATTVRAEARHRYTSLVD